MTVPHTADVLVIGGGATGAGVVRDLARRGLRALLVERGDYGTGTTGRYHGLLHSGGRYVQKDQVAARECIEENRVLRRIAPASIEDTGGFFVATPDDPDEYVEAFAANCEASGVDCDEVDVPTLLEHEPALDRRIRRAFRVPDGSIEPWQLIESTLADARLHGSDAASYQRVIGFEVTAGRITAAVLRDERNGAETKVWTQFVVSAAGAWAGQIAAFAGVDVEMTPGKGTMLIYNHRMTDAVINRCHKSSDGDIMVPVHTVAILGTTDIKVADPDDYDITREEVAQLVDEGAKLFPDLPRMRILRAYAGVRPLYKPPAADAAGGNRSITRAHVILDHADQGVENFVSVVGGKLTTHRLMAEQTVDVVAAKLGVTARCTTAEEPLPDQHGGATYWLGHRLAEIEQRGGGDADLLCECELVTRPMAETYLDEHWPCTIDDVRRGTRVGMGPCQGAFCTFRVAGLVAERLDASAGDGPADRAEHAAIADRALGAFLRERFKGTRPIAHGRQLQELLMTNGIYTGVLGLDSMAPAVGPSPVTAPEAVDAAR
ncbi:MAG TPA: anaerobic glycerol-3-phosphate dehydrogenase subunit GlpA [Candidatus Limnocylindrales bacterium]|nr:anaerobic glycerol-3-phosphate dehydrogenase subunit GlpA [Candidatus Limnocylindrales bacterium]